MGIILNIFNGDSAYAAWKKAGLPGIPLIWRENYLHGALPSDGYLVEFCRARAAELVKLVPEKSVAEIFDELMEMNRILLSLTSQDTVYLWFDTCPFDRTMLSRILYLLNGLDDLPSLFLFFCDVAWDIDEFQRSRDARLLSRADLKYGADEWNAYLNGKNAETLLDTFSHS